MATDDNKEINLFFQLLEWLKVTESDSEGDVETWLLKYPELDYKKKQLAYDEKQKVVSFFETVIDQPAFATNDHKRLRKFLIDWYSSHRTYITQIKHGTDPFSMSSEALNEIIRSFGFPYPHKIISSTRKAQFILDLINLYHKKGTPSVLVSTLQTYFGLTNVVLSEWWIHRDNLGGYFAKSLPVFPKGLRYNPLLSTEIPYNNFILDDPLWQLTEVELDSLYNTSKITLPSLTSHISLQATISIGGVNSALAILNRKIQESYEYWQATGDLNRNISSARMDIELSLLELTLGICYLFNSSADSTDKNHLYYQGRYTPLDIPDETGARDDIDDVEFGLIIDEYNNINKRPLTRAEKTTNLKTRKDSFTGPIADHSINNVLDNPGPTLGLINPAFKAEIDDYINAGGNLSRIIEDFLHDLEYYLMEVLEIMNFPISYLIINAPIEDSLKPIIDFFKPYRTRVRDFLTTLAFDDKLGDSQLEEDIFKTQLNQQFVDKGYLSNIVFDQGLAEDGVNIIITQPFYDFITSLDNYLHDIYSLTINQMHEMLVTTNDNYKIAIHQNHADYGPMGLDFGMTRDSLVNTAIFQTMRSDANIFLKCIFENTVKQRHDDNLTYLDNVNITIKNPIIETGPFGLDNGMNKDLAILVTGQTFREYLNGRFDSIQLRDDIEFSKINQILPENVIHLDNNIICPILSMDEKGSFGIDNGQCKDDLDSSINNIINDRAFNPELDEGGLDVFSLMIAERIVEDCVAQHNTITSINLPIIEMSDGEYFDTSMVRDTFSIEVIDL